jgi:Ca-activated chloride channel family protein
VIEWFQERFAPGPIFVWVCLAALLLIPLIWLRARSRAKRPTMRFSSFRWLEGVPTGAAAHFWFIPPLLRSLALLCVIGAIARPQSGGEYSDSREGIAIQLVLDVSGSMQQDDFVLNGQRVRRIDVVKTVLEEFVLGKGGLRGREGDLVGLTTFAMFADTVSPLTLDHGSLADLLRQTEIPGFVNGVQVRQEEEANYTSIGDALTLATDDLRRAGEQAVEGVPGAEAAKSRIIILLTDGADNPPRIPGLTPISPLEAAKVAAKLGVKVYTIGAGSDQPRGAGFGSFFGQRPQEFDEESLKQIAAAANGRYFRATDTQSLETIYEEIDKLERRKTGERTFHDNVGAARTAMLAALGLLMGEVLLVQTRFRRIP